MRKGLSKGMRFYVVVSFCFVFVVAMCDLVHDIYEYFAWPMLIAKTTGNILLKTSSPKGNDAHLRAIIQSEKKWKHQFFRCLRAASSVVRGRIWPNFKLIQALMYVIITCKYEKDPIKNNREKVATPFFKL